MVANTSTSQRLVLDVIVEFQLSTEGDQFRVLYSNMAAPTVPQPVRTIARGSVTVQEVDGSIGVGPLHVVRVTLRSLEVQIMRNIVEL